MVLAILFGLGGVLAWQKYNPSRMLASAKGISDQKAVHQNGFYHFTFLGRRFAVPDAYMESYQHTHDGKIAGFDFHAYLPNLEGYSPENESKKAFLDSPDRVSVNLSYSGMTEQEAYKRWYEFGYWISEQHAKRQGTVPVVINEQPRVERTLFIDRNEFFLIDEEKQVLRWMSCLLPATEMRGVSYPTCRMTLMYGDYLIARAFFDRKEEFVTNWVQIGDRILEKLKSFEENTGKM